MAYFDCIVGGSGKGNTLVVTCADDLAGATITCTNGTKTYNKTCPSTSPYEVTFYGLAAGTYTVSATVSGNTYTTTVVITDYEAELGGFSWRAWVDLSKNYTSSDFTDLDDLLDTELAVRELMSIHACVDYLAGIATESADVETIIGNDLCAKWINNRDYALDALYANTIIKSYMDTADKYFYGEWCLVPQVPTMTSNTVPYGVASADSEYSTNYAYLAFDGIESGEHPSWISNKTKANANQAYIQYKFVKPVVISSIKIIWSEWWDSCTFEILASNDDFTTSDNLGQFTGNNTQKITVNPNKNSYNAYRLQLISQIGDLSYAGNIISLQFYAWQPKGNVPVMTSNTAPYGTAFASSVYSPYEAWKAFDNDGSSIWASYTGTNNEYLGYVFTNPIKVKKVHIRENGMIGTFQIMASNTPSDQSSYVAVSDVITGKGTAGASYDVVLDNDEYYLAYKLQILTHVSGSTYSYNIDTLQFYGRELSVSVPKMDTNTTPYGTAFADSEATLRPAYKAFDGGTAEENTWFTTGLKGSLTNKGIGYTFTNKMIPKMAVLKFYNSGSLISTVSYKFQGYNGTTWEDLSDNITDKTGTICVFDNTSEYDTIRLFLASQNMNNSNADTGGVSTLQFYGLDYSEKEFEEGTTKKWLYDHGVELETALTYITGTSVVTKRTDDIYMKSVSGEQARIYFDFNLGSFSLLRAKMGKEIVNATKNSVTFHNMLTVLASTSTSDYTQIATLNLLPTNDPNNHGLDISSVSSGYPYIYGAGNDMVTTLTEMWLE